MPRSDRYVFDLHTEHPNVDINTMRLLVEKAVADLEDRRADVDDSLYLADVLFDLLDGALADLATAAAERQQLHADLDALTARVTALEPAPPPAPI